MNVRLLSDHKISEIALFWNEILCLIWIKARTVAKEIVTTKVKKYMYKLISLFNCCSHDIGKLINGFKKIKCPFGLPVNCPLEILEISASSFVPYTANLDIGITK